MRAWGGGSPPTAVRTRTARPRVAPGGGAGGTCGTPGSGFRRRACRRRWGGGCGRKGFGDESVVWFLGGGAWVRVWGAVELESSVMNGKGGCFVGSIKMG